MLEKSIKFSANPSNPDANKNTNGDPQPIFFIYQTLSIQELWNTFKRFLGVDDQIKIERLSTHSLSRLSLTPVSHFSKLWNTPEQKEYFIRRPHLDIMKEALKTNWVVVCHGLGGVGKTALALEFVRENCAKYDRTAWFNAKNVDKLLLEYDKLGQDLNLPLENDMKVRGRQVKDYLEDSSHGSWLLVYDNVQAYDEPEGIRSLIPSPSGDSRVVITSRLPKAPYRLILEIGKFSRDESIKCIQKILEKSLSKKSNASTKNLAKTLKYLPLGLVQASMYIEKTQITVSDYLTLYKTKERDLFKDKIDAQFIPVLQDNDAKEGVYIHWNIAMENMLNESHLALNWLKVCSYLANEIPDFLFKAFAKQENNSDEENYEKAREILKSYSMLTMNEKNKSWSMDSLLQEVIRMREEEAKTQEIILLKAANLLQKCCSEGNQIEDYTKMRQLLPHFQALLPFLEKIAHTIFAAQTPFLCHLSYQADICGTLGNPNKQAELLEEKLSIQKKLFVKNNIEIAETLINLYEVYVILLDTCKQKAVLEEALFILEENYDTQNVQVARISLSLGAVYCALGKPYKQQELQDQMLPILEKHYGSNHVEIARALLVLGAQHSLSGEFHKEKELLEKALSIYNKQHEKNDIETVRILNRLGFIYGLFGHPREQKEISKRARTILKNNSHSKHPEMFKTLVALGEAHGALGDPHQYKKLLKKARSIVKRCYGTNHVYAAITLGILAEAYGDLGKPIKQKKLLERALPILEEHYGNNTVPVAIALKHLGQAYGALGNPLKQKKFLKQALTIFEHCYGSNHVAVARTLVSLGNANGALGNFHEQKKDIERARPILEKYYGKEHFEVAIALISLGNAYGALNNHDKKRELLEKARGIQEKHYHNEHFEVARTLVSLGDAHGALGKPLIQKELLERALPILEEHYGKDHFEVAIALVSLGNAYGALGKLPKHKYEELFERALTIQKKYYSNSDHFMVARTLENFGNAYGASGDPRNQRKLLEQALPILEKHYGEDHLEVARTLVSLGDAYGALGKPLIQKELLEQALSIKEKHYHKDHFYLVIALEKLGNCYSTLRDRDKQREAFERALSIKEKHYGRDHFQLVSTLKSLAKAYDASGDSLKKEALLERAYTILKAQPHNQKLYRNGVHKKINKIKKTFKIKKRRPSRECSLLKRNSVAQILFLFLSGRALFLRPTPQPKTLQTHMRLLTRMSGLCKKIFLKTRN